MLLKQPHMPRKPADLSFIPAHGNSQIPQLIPGGAGHFPDKLIVRPAALRQVGEIEKEKSGVFRLAKFFPECLYLLRGAFQDGDRKFDDAGMQAAILVMHIGADDLRHVLPQRDAQVLAIKPAGRRLSITMTHFKLSVLFSLVIENTSTRIAESILARGRVGWIVRYRQMEFTLNLFNFIKDVDTIYDTK